MIVNGLRWLTLDWSTPTASSLAWFGKMQCHLQHLCRIHDCHRNHHRHFAPWCCRNRCCGQTIDVIVWSHHQDVLVHSCVYLSLMQCISCGCLHQVWFPFCDNCLCECFRDQATTQFIQQDAKQLPRQRYLCCRNHFVTMGSLCIEHNKLYKHMLSVVFALHFLALDECVIESIDLLIMKTDDYRSEQIDWRRNRDNNPKFVMNDTHFDVLDITG